MADYGGQRFSGLNNLHPAALLIALLLHGAALLALQQLHQAPPPVPISFSVELPVEAPEALDAAAASTPSTPVAEPDQSSLPAPAPQPEESPPPQAASSPQPSSPAPEKPLSVPDTSTAEASSPTSEHPVADLPLPPPPPVQLKRPAPVPRAKGAMTPSKTAAHEAQAASAPATPSAAAATQPVSQSWRGQFSAWLLQQRVYPEAARRNGNEGTVTVRFTVLQTGNIESVTLINSSGSGILDEAALAMLRGAHAPPFPVSMTQSSLTITVPIHYRLEH
jgi:periplasmic protein TonB